MTWKKRAFDCVEMMHACQAAVQKRLTGLSREDQLEYWKLRHQEALVEQKRLREAATAKR
jgi:hypothetical protein